ncbi:DUF1104 domain-containing protein [Sulfurimonas sp. SAG-AH-194-I05]|nr:DUF1104 domain-containing protein [Sulfurimonas sp. SAG-AH-194-I05]MDF1874303.1 DUF1104 domain-containing protein [Sulfurimonas sp. SAG-AH-194-I05]
MHISTKIFFISLVLINFLHANENFTEMSTQELIEIIGYVKASDEVKFKDELESREPFMNEKERKKYNENKKKLK